MFVVGVVLVIVGVCLVVVCDLFCRFGCGWIKMVIEVVNFGWII